MEGDRAEGYESGVLTEAEDDRLVWELPGCTIFFAAAENEVFVAEADLSAASEADIGGWGIVKAGAFVWLVGEVTAAAIVLVTGGVWGVVAAAALAVDLSGVRG